MSGTGADYHIQLLGGFHVTRDGGTVPLGPSGERLVALVACRSGPQPRHLVAGLLWPDRPEDRAKANLRSAVHRVAVSHPGLVASSARHVELGSLVAVDFRHASAAAHRILAGSVDSVTRELRTALTVDLLPCCEDDWIADERETYRQNRLHALEILCLALAEAGRYGEAVDAALAAIRAEPLRESAHRALVTVHLREGNYREALRQYERCRALLRDELGIGPSGQLRELISGAFRPSRRRDGGVTRFVSTSTSFLADDRQGDEKSGGSFRVVEGFEG